ncbi:MAG: AMP-binding protein [Desulfarculaceae bacterium]|jgi:acyl-CoA synthetase (AMP-forming)/AMP-acid ligase II
MKPGLFFLWPVDRYRERTALVLGEERLTFGQTDAAINRLCHGLLSLGLHTGHKVAVLMGNCLEAAFSIFAIPRAGLTYVTLNARHSAREHLEVLQDAGVDALIAGEEFIDLIQPVLDQAAGLKHLIALGPERPGWLSYEALTAGQDETWPEIEVDPENDIERIHYTSGTTGRPKGAVWPFAMSKRVIASILMNMDKPLGPADVNLNIGPLTHAAGLMMMVYYCRGATNIVLPRFDEKLVLSTIERERVTSVLLIPTMLYRILARNDLADYDLSSVNRVWYGTAPMAVDRLRQGIELFGSVFRQNYGMTEIPQPITFLGPEDHITQGSAGEVRRLSSAGRPALGVEVRVVDEQGNDLSSGQIGEIIIRCDKMISGYWNLPQETAAAFRDGWFHTHDMGTWDQSGFLYIMDRKNDMIITGGFNVYPREVEEVIMELEGVAEVVAIGVPDPLWGEAVKALVVLQPGWEVNTETILEHCRKNLAGYKMPKSVDYIQAAPKNLYGKIDRRALREPYWSGAGRRVN